MASDILIVDDETDIRELVAGILQDEGHGTRTARDSDEALAAVVARRPNLVFLDIWLQGSRLDGLQLLDGLKQEHPELPIVMISGHGNIETAVSAIKRGAYDFIEKPFKADRLLLVAERALENSRLRREVRELKQFAPLASTLVGRSPAANQLRQTIEKVAPTNSRILIVGPSGSGKELAARTIHGHSSRADGPFVVINAAAITPEYMEVELFGVEGGNGTTSRKVGALEEAHGGTLFIDEIADMPRETQNKILRVLVDQTFQRVGGSTKVTVDVRIVSSTSRNIEADIAAGKFREDLYHRLSVVPIRVPGLSERREDIPELVEYFMSQISQTTGLPKRNVGADALAVLQSHDWPGNVRQLRNNVERLMILAGGEPEAVITASMLPQDVGSMIPNMPNGNGGEHLMSLALREAREVFEREYLSGADQSLRRQYFAHRRIRRHGAFGAAPQAQGARDRLTANVPHRLRQRPLSAACHAKVHVEDRGYQFGDGVYEVCEVRDGRLIDERRHLERLQRSLAELRIRLPISLNALDVVLHEVVGAKPDRLRHRLSADHPRRGAARSRLSGRAGRARARGDGARVEQSAQRGARGAGHRRHHRARQPLGPGRYQDDRAVAQCAGAAGRHRAGRPRRLVRRS